MKASSPLRILIVEDDPLFIFKLKKKVGDSYTVCDVQSKEEALEKIHAHVFDLALIDLDLDGKIGGIEVLKECRKLNIESIILTDHTEKELIKEAYEVGCSHYLNKEQCETVIEHILSRKNDDFCSYTKVNRFLQNEFITQHQDLIQQIKFLQKNPFQNKHLLILGETGTGKGVLAQLIHQLHGGPSTPFISINMASIPENMVETELFGHKKGSFTGAISDHKGKLEMANGGTLFLDEIGAVSTKVQQKLLKAIEEKSFYPLGSNQLVQSHFNLICATCDNIYQKIRNGEFRLDFFHRINGTTLSIPPLRDRKDDIPILLEAIMKKNSRFIHITEKALECLMQYRWTGNVRELKMLVEQFLFKEGGIVDKKDLPEYIRENFDLTSSRCSKSFIPDDQVSFIKKEGLKSFIDKVEIEVFGHFHHQGQLPPDEIKEIMQLSRSSYYRLLRRWTHSKEGKNVS